MLSIEEQIERLADAAVEQLERDAATPSLNAHAVVFRTRSSRWVGVGVTVLVIGLLIGLAWLFTQRVAPSEPADQQVLPPVPSGLVPPNEPTVDYDADQIWLVPTDLPDEFEFAVATDFGELGGPGWALVYESTLDGRQVTIRTNTPIATSLDTDDTVDIAGVRWSIQRTDQEDGTESFMVFRVDGDLGTVVSGDGMDLDSLVRVVAGLEPQAATVLARPPIPVMSDRGVVVANAEPDGVPKQLLAETDGRYFALNVDGGGGSPERLGDGFITVAGAMGPNPNLVLNGQEADSLIWGLLHPDVATVDVVLTDGRVITTPAQDDYGFSENFFLVAFPTHTDGGLELLSTIVARDAAGNELARTQGLE